nr:MAG TPA: hypothetical protein [Caudoviricetes sp.]
MFLSHLKDSKFAFYSIRQPFIPNFILNCSYQKYESVFFYRLNFFIF